MSLRRFEKFLVILAVMIVGLMALGAGVRTMNAGLSCPDWPLCFGKVIPDFHVGVWFEFVHRAYAGVVALLYAATLVIALRLKTVPRATKTAAKFGLGFLLLQIVMGGLTVLMLVKAVIVTTHLLLATCFLSCVLWMSFGVHAELKKSLSVGSTSAYVPERPRAAEMALMNRIGFLRILLPALVFIQIAIGGFVASTYAGMICVDWPYCNGQWVPTLKGPMGLQTIHRFYAYGLVLIFMALAIFSFAKRALLPKTIARFFFAGGVVVLLQTLVGILNLIYFIPPQITVLHQSLGMALLAVSLKLSFELRESALRPNVTAAAEPFNSSENLAAGTATLS